MSSKVINKEGLHVAIIMDGNGRFAAKYSQPRLFGHQAGAQVLFNLADACPRLGIHTLTVFAFAKANWKRDKEEVDGLWNLFAEMVDRELKRVAKEGVRVRMIGDRAGLPADTLSALEKVEEETKHNDTLLLQIALNYDGVDEVARLIRERLPEDLSKVDSDFVREHLDTEAGNEPDVVIRSGLPEAKDDMTIWRSSGFLPIQSAQAVCVGTTMLWPDLTPRNLAELVAYAAPEERLFGGQRPADKV